MKPTVVASNSTYIENGLIEIFGQDLAELKEGTPFILSAVKAAAVQKYGEAETSGMFLRAGRAAFYFWMRENAKDLGWLEVEYRLLPAPLRIKRSLADALKWFDEAKMLKGELSSNNDNWQISVQGLMDQTGCLDCSTFTGLIQELVCWAGAGKFYAAREMECGASGAESCRFEISKMPAG